MLREHLARLVVDAREQPLAEKPDRWTVDRGTTGAQHRAPARTAHPERRTVQHHTHAVTGVRSFPTLPTRSTFGGGEGVAGGTARLLGDAPESRPILDGHDRAVAALAEGRSPECVVLSLPPDQGTWRNRAAASAEERRRGLARREARPGLPWPAPARRSRGRGRVGRCRDASMPG
ncbi:hypothetical protein ACFY1J_07445 [Streptomyces sp. NPDC001406]|uniref:hypothetical protein n=1 Tax=Streptomyces sp. NPDC001406 TaxID=3364572 RepID=UPI0036BE54ED